MKEFQLPDKEKITALFDLVADIYENPSTRFFAFCGDHLASLLKATAGQKILDVACGTGCTSIALAQTIQAGGRVSCIDLSAAMLKKAEYTINRAGLTNVDYHIMDGQNLEFKSQYFDALTCSYGIFFMPDMDAALQSWLRVLKPGGRVIFTSFSEKAFEPLTSIFLALMCDFDIDTSLSKWQRLKNSNDCRELLQRNGYENITIKTRQLGYHLRDFNDWWEVLWSTGYRGLLEQFDDLALAKFRIELSKKMTHLNTKDGIWMDVETHFSTALRPSKLKAPIDE